MNIRIKDQLFLEMISYFILDYILNFRIRLLVPLAMVVSGNINLNLSESPLSDAKLWFFSTIWRACNISAFKISSLLIKPMNSSWRAPTRVRLLKRASIGFSNSEQSPSSCHFEWLFNWTRPLLLILKDFKQISQ